MTKNSPLIFLQDTILVWIKFEGFSSLLGLFHFIILGYITDDFVSFTSEYQLKSSEYHLTVGNIHLIINKSQIFRNNILEEFQDGIDPVQ